MRRLTPIQRVGFNHFRGRYRTLSVDLLICGVGGAAAVKSLRRIMKIISPRQVIIAGWAGALSDSRRLYELVCPRILRVWPGIEHQIDTTVIRMDLTGAGDPDLLSGGLVTSPVMVDTTVKKSFLREAYDCDLVDMETYHLADCLLQSAVPFRVLRVITDTADERIGLPFDRIPKHRWTRRVFWICHPVLAYRMAVLNRVLQIATRTLNHRLIQLLNDIPSADMHV